jgi:hypothetical protein
MNKKIGVICTIIVLAMFLTGCTINNYYAVDKNKTKELKNDCANDDQGPCTGGAAGITPDQDIIKDTNSPALNF